VIERLAYAFKNIGDAFDKWAKRLKTEPSKQITLEDIDRLVERRVNEAMAAAVAAKRD
jgi:hypothetical protein